MRKSKFSKARIVGILMTPRVASRWRICCGSTASARPRPSSGGPSAGGATMADVKRLRKLEARSARPQWIYAKLALKPQGRGHTAYPPLSARGPEVHAKVIVWIPRADTTPTRPAPCRWNTVTSRTSVHTLYRDRPAAQSIDRRSEGAEGKLSALTNGRRSATGAVAESPRL